MTRWSTEERSDLTSIKVRQKLEKNLHFTELKEKRKRDGETEREIEREREAERERDRERERQRDREKQRQTERVCVKEIRASTIKNNKSSDLYKAFD